MAIKDRRCRTQLGSPRFWCQLLAVAVLTSVCAGCNMVILAGYLIGGPPSIEPDFDLQTGTSLQHKKKTVAVVVYAPKELRFQFADIDKNLAKHIAYRFNNHSIKVINPDRVQDWLDKNDQFWETGADVGKALKADYVINIELHEFSLYELDSPHLYRGHTNALVQVFDLSQDEGSSIYSKDLASVYPIHAPVSTNDIAFNRFKRLYISRLSDEIGRLFYEHYAGDDIPHGAHN